MVPIMLIFKNSKLTKMTNKDKQNHIFQKNKPCEIFGTDIYLYLYLYLHLYLYLYLYIYIIYRYLNLYVYIYIYLYIYLRSESHLLLERENYLL